MRIARATLWFSALVFGGFGLAFTFFPIGMAAQVQIGLPTATAQTDFTATYGGLELGIAAFLVWCALRPERVRAGLMASGWALVGMGVVRLVGIVMADEVLPILYPLLVAEAAGTALSFWAAGRARHAP